MKAPVGCFVLLLGAVVVGESNCRAAETAARPNIVFIVADDK